ncbi:hypothetical protein ADU37_CDS05010 [Thermococcus sp. 2319x1]|uniref:hypothetical protein n=1 Tax=Thermococcus sp. 2319x1 TaxID=1674923 RepID=UPI00073AD0E3|nr:hypothetical protein [Thermococcus sp. 2319x1]ALV62200.1 hypothetical protein ADU37_CDS05010 [Thermococcus sp. 2319x1]
MDLGKAVFAFIGLGITLFLTLSVPSIEQVIYDAFTPLVFQASQEIQAYDWSTAFLIKATWILVGVSVIISIVTPIMDALMELISSLR